MEEHLCAESLTFRPSDPSGNNGEIPDSYVLKTPCIPLWSAPLLIRCVIPGLVWFIPGFGQLFPGWEVTPGLLCLSHPFVTVLSVILTVFELRKVSQPWVIP